MISMNSMMIKELNRLRKMIRYPILRGKFKNNTNKVKSVNEAIKFIDKIDVE